MRLSASRCIRPKGGARGHSRCPSYLGILMAAVGGFMVTKFKPAPGPPPAPSRPASGGEPTNKDFLLSLAARHSLGDRGISLESAHARPAHQASTGCSPTSCRRTGSTRPSWVMPPAPSTPSTRVHGPTVPFTTKDELARDHEAHPPYGTTHGFPIRGLPALPPDQRDPRQAVDLARRRGRLGLGPRQLGVGLARRRVHAG